jgi:hypothetical protein
MTSFLQPHKLTFDIAHIDNKCLDLTDRGGAL